MDAMEWPPLVINEPNVLVKFYQLKYTSSYDNDCDFLMILLEQYETQNNGDGTEQDVIHDQDQMGIKEENSMANDDYLPVECKLEYSEKNVKLELRGSSDFSDLEEIDNVDDDDEYDDYGERVHRKRSVRITKLKKRAKAAKKAARAKAKAAAAKPKPKPKRPVKSVSKETTTKCFGENKGYTCYFCSGTDFASAKAVKDHFQELHPNDQPFKCVVCNETFVDYPEFKRHIRKQKHQGIYRCDGCEKTFFRNDNFKDHMMRWHSDEKNYKCDLCERSYFLKCSLIKHRQLVHPEAKSQPGKNKIKQNCHICNLDFESIKALKDHFKLTHPKDKPIIARNPNFTYRCEPCDKNFCNKSYMNEHNQRWHSNGESFPCDECDKKYTTSNSLNKHKNTFHKNVNRYNCDQCGKKCYNATLLRDHKEMHQGIKRVCHVCGKRFDTQFSLKYHVKFTHSDIPRTHSCEVCGNKYKTVGELKSHLRVHDKNRTRDIQCEKCDKTFMSKSYFNKHMKWHNGIKDYGCEVCSKRFMFPTTLKEHLRTHTGERPHKCTMCSSDFKHSGALYKHVQLKHKGFKISLKGVFKANEQPAAPFPHSVPSVDVMAYARRMQGYPTMVDPGLSGMPGLPPVNMQM